MREIKFREGFAFYGDFFFRTSDVIRLERSTNEVTKIVFADGFSINVNMPLKEVVHGVHNYNIDRIHDEFAERVHNELYPNGQ